MDHIIAVILIGIASATGSIVTLPLLKILQLSGYKSRGIFAWYRSTGHDIFIRHAALALFSFIAMMVYIGCFGAFEYARYCAVALYLLLAAVFVASTGKSGCNDVKITGRMLRLIVAVTVIDLVLGAGMAWAAYYSPFFQSLVAVLPLISTLIVVAANFIMTPFEKLNNGRYVKRAKAKLAEQKPTVIGITGSYGKTTAKNLLRDMLSYAGTVLATPGSFNTPMGVCKTINDSLDGQKYFIAELGARYPGDISELCSIVSPAYGMITAIGDMHLQTLRSREGVANAKFELAKNLPETGLLVLNGRNADCAALKDRACPCAVDVTGEGGRVDYRSLSVDSSGTGFVLVMDGEEYSVTTKLLGAHIAELSCVCADIALACGVKPSDIVAAICGAAPVEHRLQLIPSVDPDVTVIDDAYNSNPVGAKNALEVLARFEGKKVIITPGFVELGAIEKDCNKQLGKDISEVCDLAFLVGSRAADIKAGAVVGGMAEDAIEVFSSRDEAVKALGTVKGEKVVLFENDLPDNIK